MPGFIDEWLNRSIRILAPLVTSYAWRAPKMGAGLRAEKSVGYGDRRWGTSRRCVVLLISGSATAVSIATGVDWRGRRYGEARCVGDRAVVGSGSVVTRSVSPCARVSRRAGAHQGTLQLVRT